MRRRSTPQGRFLAVIDPADRQQRNILTREIEPLERELEAGFAAELQDDPRRLGNGNDACSAPSFLSLKSCPFELRFQCFAMLLPVPLR